LQPPVRSEPNAGRLQAAPTHDFVGQALDPYCFASALKTLQVSCESMQPRNYIFWYYPSNFQKVRQHLFAILGQDALGMELHAKDWQRLVAQPHQFALGGVGSGFEYGG